MKTIFALPLLAFGLAACQTYPPGAYRSGQGPLGYPEPASYQSYSGPDYLGAEGGYRAIGTEPFWDLTIGRDLVFTDRGNNVVVGEPAPLVQRSASGERYQGRRLSVTIERRRCSDGMSDRSYPDTVNVTVDGRAFRGCGADSAFFSQASQNITTLPGQGQHDLSNTNWRVVSVNGRSVPPSGHYFNFATDRMSGKLGCNMINSSYSVAGNMLTAGATATTRMLCENDNYEAQGLAVLGKPMTISESGDLLTLTNRAGTIEMTRAR